MVKVEDFKELKEDVKIILNNHLPHLEKKIDRMWIIMLILSFLAGINIALKLVGVV